MGIILLALITYSQPEDASPQYGMDMSVAHYSSDWEDAWDTLAHAWRTMQGSHDMQHWYQFYQAKTEIPMLGPFVFRYRFQARYDYDYEHYYHRFIGSARLYRDLYFDWVIVPYFFKENDETGFGFSYLPSRNTPAFLPTPSRTPAGHSHNWSNQSHGDNTLPTPINNDGDGAVSLLSAPSYHNWLKVHGFIEHIDHNLSMKWVRDGPEKNLYAPVPYRLEVDGRGELSWLRVRGHVELGTAYHQYLEWPDSSIYQWERDGDRSLAWGRLEVSPVKDLWLGTRVSWFREREHTFWLEQDSVIADTLADQWIKPYVTWTPTDRIKLYADYMNWQTNRDMDSVTYQRNYQIMTLLAHWDPVHWMGWEIGYQRSWRYRYNNDTLIPEPYNGRHPGQPAQSRLLINLELHFPSGFMFIVKEGLEMDFFPADLFIPSPHEHTYVGFHVPLGVIWDRSKKKCKSDKFSTYPDNWN